MDGEPVGRMERHKPINEVDNGWLFASGTEDADYLNNIENWGTYELNTIANFDKAIIPYINMPIGTILTRIKGTDKFTTSIHS